MVELGASMRMASVMKRIRGVSLVGSGMSNCVPMCGAGGRTVGRARGNGFRVLGLRTL